MLVHSTKAFFAFEHLNLYPQTNSVFMCGFCLVVVVNTSYYFLDVVDVAIIFYLLFPFIFVWIAWVKMGEIIESH